MAPVADASLQEALDFRCGVNALVECLERVEKTGQLPMGRLQPLSTLGVVPHWHTVTPPVFMVVYAFGVVTLGSHLTLQHAHEITQRHDQRCIEQPARVDLLLDRGGFNAVLLEHLKQRRELASCVKSGTCGFKASHFCDTGGALSM